MTIPIDAVIELDRLNMTPIFEAMGVTFDPILRRDRLISEIEAGSKLETIWQNNLLIAYLEFQIVENHCNVQSIQIHPHYQSGIVLANILGKTYKRLLNTPILIIHSSVHEGNIKSLSLHRNLGFDEIIKKENRVLFEISSDVLIKRLSRFEKKAGSPICRVNKS